MRLSKAVTFTDYKKLIACLGTPSKSLSFFDVGNLMKMSFPLHCIGDFFS
jgi:hypothetical protein